jgi:hypothetical protein
MKRPKDGIINSKLTPYEMLEHAMLLQAVADIKMTTWYKAPPDGMKCSYKEGLEAVDYIVLVLRQNAYSVDAIAKIFREITPHNYKYDLIKERLEKRGIEL